MKQNINWLTIIYLIKFAVFGTIASYDYSINSKWTLAWFTLTMLTLALFIVEELKNKE